LADLGFVIGCVPGCDLRLPRADLSPVVCLITRHAGGAAFRKHAPAQPVLVNGHPLTQGPLADGDRVSLGSVELLVHVTAAAIADKGTEQAALPGQEQKTLTEEQATRRRELDELARQLVLRR
jgi:predicted component of type VI protein secretion system